MRLHNELLIMAFHEFNFNTISVTSVPISLLYLKNVLKSYESPMMWNQLFFYCTDQSIEAERQSNFPPSLQK